MRHRQRHTRLRKVDGVITVYAMSAANYSNYYKKKDIRSQYDDFFNEYYLDKK